MKTEHEKLKEIADKIGYENEDYSYMFAWDEFMDWTKVYETWFYKSSDDWIAIICDVREIIFTQEFMDKLRDYSYDWWDFEMDLVWVDLLDHLDNPVKYLADLLNIK